MSISNLELELPDDPSIVRQRWLEVYGFMVHSDYDCALGTL